MVTNSQPASQPASQLSSKFVAVSRFFFAAVILLLSLFAVPVKAQVLLVPNWGSNSIAEVTLSGTVSTFVSTGLDEPSGLAVDSSGNIYDADYYSISVIKITPGGSESTFASGLSAGRGPRDDVFDNSGNLFVSLSTGTIDKITPSGTVTAFATGLNDPIGVAFDSSGNLYVADNGSGNIYEFTSGGIRTTFASGITNVYGLAFDPYGNLFASTGSSGTIDEITPTGTVSTFKTGLAYTKGLVFDSSDNLYAGEGNGIYKINSSGGSSLLASGFNNPNMLTIDYELTPEPSTWALMIFGGMFLLFIAWQQKRKAVRVRQEI